MDRLTRALPVLVIVALLLAVPWVLNRRFNSWGTTGDETTKELPGDALVRQPGSHFTHAITIDAPAEKIWPWVIQIGMERGGWYTYDWFYNLTGSGKFVDGHSAERIVPELQTLKEGDVIKMHPAAPFKVVELVPGRRMVLKVEGAAGPSWVWVLEPLPGNKTRVLERFRTPGPASTVAKLASVYLLDPGGFVFSSKHLRGLKERAERP